MKSNGFTLIETIVSVTILAIAIVGPMTLSSQSIRASRDSRSHLEALHLAQEGVEVVRNVRDNVSISDTSLAKSGWSSALSSCAANPYGCTVNVAPHEGTGVWNDGQVFQACSQNCPNLCYDTASGMYTQGPGGCTGGPSNQVSTFSRRVTITAIPGKPQMRVTAVVSYPSVYGNRTRYATSTGDIYNWFPCLNGACPTNP